MILVFLAIFDHVGDFGDFFFAQKEREKGERKKDREKK